ncbi:Metallo-peptidase family M12B Reprolysin-like [Nocardioides exalbidus]|uniref:Metallo-peptidase family M12B Reprolysin-like n=1 Tax=Nocardioides exalbidus TaxID=402596 RepID=A0A1H4M2H8_9ACTN|nr:zinc-dependent metalloprotease family protein [Nocardioides exalbidus]SEB77249.1 Metallo-peptidase family M12B Reprolysin-like [Nocardioides exalbidus]
MPTRKVLSSIAGLATIALAASMVPGNTATAAPVAKPGKVDLLSTSDGPTRAPGLTGDRSRSVAIDESGLDAARAGDRLAIDLFGGESVTAVVDAQRTVDGVTSWTGSLAGEGGTFAAVDVDGYRHITISSAERGTYEVTSTKAGDYVLTEVPAFAGEGKDAILPDEAGADHADHADHAAPRRQAPAAGGDAASAEAPDTAEDAASTIDVAIVYPASLVAELGDGPMRAQFALGITQTNQAFAASGIPTQVRLVGTRQLAQPQLASTQSSLYALQNPSDGQYDEVAGFREEVHADLVSMWHSNYPGSISCGIGYIGSGDAKNDPNYAFTALYGPSCATGNMTFAHELGHNLSADHDAGASSPPSSRGKAYARGYVDLAARTYTVMAYPSACDAAGVSCTRAAVYSGPGVLWNGIPQGNPAIDNTRAINEQIGLAANYRQSQIYPGTVAITGSARYKGTAVATPAGWTPAVSFSYQWYVDGVAVPGAVGATYTPGASLIGHALSVGVVGSAPFYSSVGLGSAPVAIGKATFKTKRPKLKGVPRAGRVLTVKLKGWKPKPGKKGVKVRYQWMRNGKKIKGAKKASYRLGRKDRGKKVSVVVKVKKKNYDTAKKSSKKVKVRR